MLRGPFRALGLGFAMACIQRDPFISRRLSFCGSMSSSSILFGLQ